MLDEINVLREKLDEQVLHNAPYDEILTTSRELDELIMNYYISQENLKKVV